MDVAVVIAPLSHKDETCQIYQEIGGCCKLLFYLQNSVLIRSISFECICSPWKSFNVREKTQIFVVDICPFGVYVIF